MIQGTKYKIYGEHSEKAGEMIFLQECSDEKNAAEMVKTMRRLFRNNNSSVKVQLSSICVVRVDETVVATYSMEDGPSIRIAEELD